MSARWSRGRVFTLFFLRCFRNITSLYMQFSAIVSHRIPSIMKHALLLLLVSVIPALCTLGCGSSGDATLATIGSYTLTTTEFERQYIKNNGGQAAADTSTVDQRREFLDLLVKYRLKVLAAFDAGYDKDDEIQKELTEYRNSLATPYLLERILVDRNVGILYERRKEDVRVAHILLRVVPDSSGVADTMSVYTTAMRVIALSKSGVPFDSLARTYSQDPRTASVGGDLRYFTAGMTTPAFEDQVYGLKPGQVGDRPVRTPFGYHVVKLLERVPARGELEVSHIFVRVEPGTDTAAAWAKISDAQFRLKQGKSFAEVATALSEDSASAIKGGALNPIGRGRVVPEFEDAAYALKVGETSGIVKSMFGYHILKLTGEKPARSLDEARGELKDVYRQFGYDEDYATFRTQAVKKYQVTTRPEAVDALARAVDTTSTTAVAGWFGKIPKEVKDQTAITLTGKTLTVQDVVTTIERNRDLQGQPLNRTSLSSLMSMIGEKEALAKETADLESRYPEFADLMREYREGVLLFKAEQDNVWSKVVVSDSALRQFWTPRRAEYRWPDRVQFSEIFLTNDSLVNVVLDSLRQGVNFSDLAERNTHRIGYREKKGDWGMQTVSYNDLSRLAMTMEVGAVQGPVKYQYGKSIIKVTAKEPAREKTFEEAQSEVSSKFQEFESKRLEREWVDRLKARYGVTVNASLLKDLFKK